MIPLLVVSLALGSAARAQSPAVERAGPRCVSDISDEEAAEIGQKIWQYEGGGKILVWWDDTGECPSFGINNYLWFQQGHKASFEESFPPLIDFMLSKGADVPKWMRSKPPAPWRTRAELFGESVVPEHIRTNPPKNWAMTPEMFALQDSPRIAELKGFLGRTVALQARYSVRRMIDSLPKMLADVPKPERPAVERQFYRVACSRGGLFDLVDYVNFKGEGTNPNERYKSPGGQMQGWGLLQVLQHMSGEGSGPAALKEFADAAEWAMRRRVDNAPAERREGDRRWLDGWIKRIRNYRGD